MTNEKDFTSEALEELLNPKKTAGELALDWKYTREIFGTEKQIKFANDLVREFVDRLSSPETIGNARHAIFELRDRHAIAENSVNTSALLDIMYLKKAGDIIDRLKRYELFLRDKIIILECIVEYPDLWVFSDDWHVNSESQNVNDLALLLTELSEYAYKSCAYSSFLVHRCINEAVFSLNNQINSPTAQPNP